MICSYILIGCCLEESGSARLSLNITDSKKSNLFISEWSSIENPIIINDTFSIHVSDIWMEKYWHYEPPNCRDIKIVEGIYQIGLNYEIPNISARYHFKWYLKTHDYDCWINPKANGLSIRKVPIDADTLILDVFMRDTEDIAYDTVSHNIRSFIITKIQ